MISKDDVLKVAKLSRLELGDDELEKFRVQLENVLKLFEEVQKVDVDSVGETSQVTGLQDVVRADEIRDNSTSSDELLKNVPIKQGTNIVVPKIVGSK